MTLLYIFAFILALALHSASTLEVSGNIVTIHNASDFIELSDNVNNNSISYHGSTVLLAADIDFTGYSDKFNPIGTNTYLSEPYAIFRGSFDGQGHVISNLAINSSRRYIAIFGVTDGTNFENLVLDSSCSILGTNNLANYSSYLAGFVGFMYPYGNTTFISGCVNMASVTFTGKRTSTGEGTTSFTIGGVIGFGTQKSPTSR